MWLFIVFAIASTVIESTLLQSALRQILHGLRSMDRIHLISFHSFARADFINGSFAEKAQLQAAVDALHTRSNHSIRPVDGSDPVPQDISNISEGLWIAQRLLVGPLASSTRNMTRRAMLFTDGQLLGSVTRYRAALDALERTSVAGVSTTVVAVGPLGWLEEAAKAGRGDYIHLQGPASFQQVVAAASPSHFPTFATNAKLRLATSFGARMANTYSHRPTHCPWTEPLVQGAADWDDELPVGVLRHGRTERLLIALDLPVYHYGADLLKYELLYQQLDGTSGSQWEQFTQNVVLPQDAVAKWPGADLLFRLDELLLEREELQRDEEVAEAQGLPVPISKGDANRWHRLSDRWRQLRSSLEALATEAAASQKLMPSLSELSIMEKIWKTLEMTKLAGRGNEVVGATAAPFGVCQGTPETREVFEGPEGLGLPNSR
ncbi:unnamed protein product [Durusdinium trenchii]|uniref:VWFA domain-containing protein n=1 Tax=Durusdinium trenchii TaxID=1381693 RepID=A0ABP0SWJ3_9DINO